MCELYHKGMNAIDILSFMGELGIRYRESDIPKAIDYLKRMIADKRVIVGYGDEGISLIVLFSICNDWKPYLLKKTWEYMEHDPLGYTAYLEKIGSKVWNRDIRNEVEREITYLYPSAVLCKAHRYGKIGDREVTTHRRLTCLETIQ